MSYRQSPPPVEDTYVYRRISNPPSSPLQMLASVVLNEKALLSPRPILLNYGDLHGYNGFNSTTPILFNGNYHRRPSCVPPIVTSVNSSRNTSCPVVLPSIQSLLGNSECVFPTRPSLPTPPLLDNEIFSDKILLSNMTSVLSRTDSLCNALRIMRKQLCLQMKSSKTPLMVGADRQSVVSFANFNCFKDQIPEKTIEFMSKDLVVLADCLRLIWAQRCSKVKPAKLETVTPPRAPRVVKIFRRADPKVSKTNRQTRKSIVKAAPSYLANSSCQHCGLRETPEWRKGPDGFRSLCNACGLFYSKLQRRFGRQETTKGMKTRKSNGEYLNRVVPAKI